MFKRKKVRLFRHQFLVLFIIAIAVVFSLIGGSYAIFSSTSKANEYNVLKVGELEISYVDTGDGYGDVLSLNGAYPVSDTEGASGNPYRFNITNTGTITADFKIKILYDEAIIEEDDCTDNLLLQKYIKYKFDNGEPTLLSSKESNDYTVYEASNLLPGSSEIHEIRIWIDENATNEVLGKHFHGKVVIESTQSGIDESLKIEYSKGQEVILKDGSKWHVLENSTSTMATVTLLSDYNINSDGSYNTTCRKDINNSTVCNTQVFDLTNNRLTTNNSYCVNSEYGCNFYTQNGSSVISDSSIKTVIDDVYASLLKQSLTLVGGTLEDLTVSLPTMEQLATCDNQTFNQEVITFTTSFLTTTSYWTKTPTNLNSYQVWGVLGNSNNSSLVNANDSATFGIRPVIVISKSNIQ